MGERRSRVAIAIALVLCNLLFNNNNGGGGKAEAAGIIYNVGDDLGWTFNVSSWPTGKTFHAGDILAFNYTPSAHNVVIVDKVGYNWCLINPIGATVHHSGNDQIKLLKGINYLICSLPGHCQMGMKLSITAD